MPDLLIPARASCFSPDLPMFQIAWDSTSLGTAKECWRKYYYTLILGWRPKRESVHLLFGRLYHSAMETYDHHAAKLGKLDGKLDDEEHNAGVRLALRKVLEDSATWEEEQCIRCEGNGKLWLLLSGEQKQVSCVQCEGTGKFKRFVAPWRSDDPTKNIWTLCRSVVWYLDYFRKITGLHTVVLSNGKPAVELSFYFEGGSVNGHTFGYCGHLDRVVESEIDNGRKSVHDRKTTKGQLNSRYWDSFNPHNQFTLYTGASAIHYEQPTWGITVDAAQLQVNSTKFERRFIAFPPKLVEEWFGEANWYITTAHRLAEHAATLPPAEQYRAYPRNDKSCDNYGGCPFRGVCSKSQGFRQNWLEADFTYMRWNPLEIRGDI